MSALLLITQRDKKSDKLGWLSSLESSYIRFFEKNDFSVVPASNHSGKLAYILNKLPITHIVLSGGNNICPELYGGENKYTEDCSSQRDRTEGIILNFAMRKMVPVLGICRGMQFINVYFGGKLIQNIWQANGVKDYPDKRSHFVEVVDKKLESILKKRRYKVNSYHNQGVDYKCLGSPLEAFAVSGDGSLVEGLFHKSYPIAGIQWHPERKGAPKELDKILIKNFIKGSLYWKKK